MAEVVEEMNMSEHTSVEEKSDLEESTTSIVCLKEHERLDVLLSKIPLKAQTKFLSTCDLILTCIDANTSYIVLGSNIGLIFVFCREDSTLQKIKVTTPNNMITTVKLHEGTDHTVAVGTATGLLCVYCIPSKASPLEKKEIQKFEVKDVHRNYITCLEWSTNGMKLCSGDTKGHVVVTEIDFYEDKCTSMVLLIDAGNEIIQLSYAQKVLAVSTMAKSYLVRLDVGGQTVDIGGNEDTFTMPGSGRFGACLIPGVYKTEDVLAYTAKQDCCLWLADVKGEVKSRHSFSFPFSVDVPEIFLHSPRKEVVMDDFQFGKLKMFKDNTVVTWQNSCVVILDPSSNNVLAFQNRFDHIVDVAVVSSGEIFVLQRKTGARVVRIAYRHDTKLGIAFNTSLLSTFLLPSITKTDDKGSLINDTTTTNNNIRRSSSINNLSVTTNIRRSSSITNLFTNTSNNGGNGGGGAFGFLKKNFVNPLKKLDHHQTNHTTDLRVIQSANIPDAKIVSENDPPDPHPSPTTPKPDENNATMALNFIRKSLVNPLKKLDHHINADTERVMITEVIPEARAQTDIQPRDNVPAIVIDSQTGASQASKFDHINRDYPEDEEGDGAIGVAVTKTKKHKKKKGKKGNHVAPIAEYKKEPRGVVDNENVTVDMSSETGKNEDDDDKSALATLRRADKLLNKINHHNHKAKEEDKHCPSGEIVVELDTVKTDLINSVDAGLESRVGDDGKENNSISQCVSIEEEECVASVSDDSIRLENSAESFNKFSLSTEHESSSSEHTRLLSENEVSGEESSNVENEFSHRYGRNIENNENERRRLINAESGIGSSPDSLNDCVERALEALSLSVDNELKREEEEKEHLEVVKVVEETNPLPLTPNSAVQNYVGFFDSVEESTLEDLYGRSVYSVGSADTVLYNDEPATASHSPRPIAVNASVNSYCAPVESPVKYQFQNLAPKVDINKWSELRTPTNIYSVSMSDTHVFYTDKTENIYHMVKKENSNSTSWRKASGKANQISVSPSGHIVWSLHKKIVYAGTKISPKYPEGLKWVENVRNVDCISVDNNSAWYITQGGSVIVETKLSLEQPIGKPRKILCPYKLKYILCRHGVVWAITERLQLLVRSGVTEDCLEGQEWKLQASNEPPFMFNHIAIDQNEVGWAVDFLGQLWFCPGVNMDHPMGCGRWWQVPLTDTLLHDENTRHLIKEVAQKFDPVKFSHIVSTSRGGLITAGAAGIYLALDFNNVFNVCIGSLQGYQWVYGPPSPLPSSSAWKLLCAGASHTNKGFVWAQHVNKDLYAFKQVKGYAKLIDNEHSFICMSANIFTVWGLTSDGRIMNRMGIDDFCPEGTSWQHLDLIQLRDIQIVHLSCSWMYVWAVDVDGQVYHRIGAKVDTPNQLSPIWLPIDNFSQIVFTKVFAGPEDWMVWAIDNRRMIYTRKGVQDTLPIGKEWVHVTGIQATEMTLSCTGVWALTPSGEVYYRQHITKDDICGKHWKKIPGLFTKISASADDDLWGVTLDGELRQCNTQHVWRTENDLEFFNQEKEVRSPSMSKKDDFDWELV